MARSSGASGPLPDFIIGGPNKCATTWTFESLKEHPDVFMPATDMINFFNIHYEKGIDWYSQFFEGHDDEEIIGEESPSYIRDDRTPQRIAESIPDVKLVFILRNPIERAYSHYWHAKSQGDVEYEFEEVLQNYDVFQTWVTTGFYHHHVTKFEAELPSKNIKILFYDDLVEDDLAFIQDLYGFLGVDDSYVPSTVNETVNEARHSGARFYREAVRRFTNVAPDRIQSVVQPFHHYIGKPLFWNRSEYESGPEPEVRRELVEVYRDDVRQLSDRVDRDLSHWLEI